MNAQSLDERRQGIFKTCVANSRLERPPKPFVPQQLETGFSRLGA
jgi:hypothetical protein